MDSDVVGVHPEVTSLTEETLSFPWVVKEGRLPAGGGPMWMLEE